jgi:hypothetical protein
MQPYAYTKEELDTFIGHWTPAEIAATGASPECIASFLGYLERVSETPPAKADKAMVTEHIQERLAANPSYDEWRKSEI